MVYDVHAADFGLPQHRRRLLLMGSRVTDPRLPRPHPLTGPSRGALAVSNREVGHRKPAAGRIGQADSLDSMHKARNHSELVIRRLYKQSLRGAPEWTCRRTFNWRVTETTEATTTSTAGCGGIGQRLRRGRTNPTRGRFAHPTQSRGLTISRSSPPSVISDGDPLGGRHRGHVSPGRQRSAATPRRTDRRRSSSCGASRASVTGIGGRKLGR